MWGAEMGINTHGVTIGNEAVFTKMPPDKGKTLTGMDMLRLALERAPTAMRALEIITELLSEYGQGGICGYTDKNFTYHNSFIIADTDEAWVLETAGHLWAALKVQDYYAISNGLTIGKEFDLSHPDLILVARKKDWLKQGTDFHFSKCYSNWFYTTFSKCKIRRNRANILFETEYKMNTTKAFAHLRDHGGAENYSPDNHFFINHICAHSANSITRDASQTVGSMVAHLFNDSITAWATGTSAPCTGLFKPIYLADCQLPDAKRPKAKYNSDSLWWRHEKLHRSILKDYPRFISAIQKEQSEFEQSFIEQFQSAKKDEKKDITKDAFNKADELTTKWLKDMPAVSSGAGKWAFHRYWKKQNRNAGIDVKTQCFKRS